MKYTQTKYKSILYDYYTLGLERARLNVNQIKIIFLLGLRDYFNHKIDLEVLEGLASELFFHSTDPNMLSKEDDSLATALDTAADLTYYYGLIKQSNQTTKRKYEGRISSLKNYYSGNKMLIKWNN